MKKENWIFILTNPRSYRDLYLSDKINLLDEQTPVLNSNFQEVHPNINLNPGLYIVFDDYTKFDSIIQGIVDTSKIFILTHTNCRNNFNTLSNSEHGFGLVKKGKHEKQPFGEYYPEVIHILENTETSGIVYEEVWTTVFTKEAESIYKLELMLICMCKEMIEQHRDKILKNPFYSKVKEFIDEMAKAHFKDPVYQKNYLAMSRVLESDNSG